MRFLLLILVGAGFATAAAAQTGPIVRQARSATSVTEMAPRETVTLQPGYAATITVDQPFAALIVGNPDIVDAIAQTDRSFVLQAKGPAGATNVILSSQTGQQIYNLNVRVGAAVGGQIKVHLGGKGLWQIQDFAAYSCSDEHCVRLPKNKERITEPVAPVIIAPNLTNVNQPPTSP